MVNLNFRREELEYSTEEELAANAPYSAPPINRVRSNYITFHLMCSFRSLSEKIKTVYAHARRPTNMKAMSTVAKLNPAIIAETMLAQTSQNQTLSGIVFSFIYILN